jgi:hypothetical protein
MSMPACHDDENSGAFGMSLFLNQNWRADTAGRGDDGFVLGRV